MTLLPARSAALRSREVLACPHLTLTADCGPLVLRDTLQYDRRTVAGQDFTAVRKGALSLYFSGDKLCDVEGHVLTTDDALASQAQLLQLAYQLVLNGTAACTQTRRHRYLYSDAGRGGSCGVCRRHRAGYPVPARRLHRRPRHHGGAGHPAVQRSYHLLRRISVALTEASASLSADIRFVSRNYPFPRAVLNALQ